MVLVFLKKHGLQKSTCHKKAASPSVSDVVERKGEIDALASFLVGAVPCILVIDSIPSPRFRCLFGLS